MAKRMVTRTFTTAYVTAIVVNKETNVAEELTLKLPFVNEAKLEKECAKAVGTDRLYFAYIKNFEILHEVLGMPEEQFLEFATPVNRATKKEKDEKGE